MRRLDRSRVAPPTCLDAFQHGRDNWQSDGVVQCKAEVRARLEEMQGRRCAYCEGDLDTLGQHIEHFRRKAAGHFPQLTFDWTNLFWSCDRKDSCGNFKEHGAGPYNVQDLVNPCEDDPDDFFRFRETGTVEARLDQPKAYQDRANETIRVFNLNLDPCGGRSLCAERRRVLEWYKGSEPDILATLEEWPAEDRMMFIQNEIAATSKQPFGTVIRHFFQEIA